jgi:hypothetical protein
LILGVADEVEITAARATLSDAENDVEAASGEVAHTQALVRRSAELVRQAEAREREEVIRRLGPAHSAWRGKFSAALAELLYLAREGTDLQAEITKHRAEGIFVRRMKNTAGQYHDVGVPFHLLREATTWLEALAELHPDELSQKAKSYCDEIEAAKQEEWRRQTERSGRLRAQTDGTWAASNYTARDLISRQTI